MRRVFCVDKEPVRARRQGDHAAEEEREREHDAVDGVDDVITVPECAQRPSAGNDDSYGSINISGALALILPT